MKRLVLCLPATALCVASLALAHAAVAQAAPPCGDHLVSDVTNANGEADVTVVTGPSTTRLIFARGDDHPPTVSNVTASVPAPGRASVTPVSAHAVDLVLDLPTEGSVAITVSWDQVPYDDNGSGTMCRATAVLQWKAVHGARVVPGAGQLDGSLSSPEVGGVFSWHPVCMSGRLVAPLTMTMRYRVGPRRPPRPVPPPPVPAPNARSPKVTLTMVDPCATAKNQIRLSRALFVRFGRDVSDDTATVAATVRRRFAGRGAFSAHMLVTFSQLGYKSIRYDLSGYSALGDYGRLAETRVKHLS